MKKKTAGTRTATPVNRTRNRTRVRRPSAAAVEFLETPMAMDSSRSQSPKSAVFGNSTKSRRTARGRSKATAESPISPPLFASPSRPPTSLGSISELKDMASSRLEDLKRHVDRSHVAIVKELDASHSRIHKRFKNQNQECQKALDEVEKEYKRTSDWIGESQEGILTSYAELMEEAQASTSQVCKSSIPKLSKSFEKAIDGLRSRYRISSA